MIEATVVQNMPNGEGLDIVDLVIDDLKARSEIGLQKYGQKLKSFNGRSALIDAYQEVLDLAQYIKQHIVENESLKAENERLKNDIERLKHSMNAINEEYKKILPAIDQISLSSGVARMIVELSTI